MDRRPCYAASVPSAGGASSGRVAGTISAVGAAGVCRAVMVHKGLLYKALAHQKRLGAFRSDAGRAGSSGDFGYPLARADGSAWRPYG